MNRFYSYRRDDAPDQVAGRRTTPQPEAADCRRGGLSLNDRTITAALEAFGATLTKTGDAHEAMRRALYATMQSPALNRIGVERCGVVLTVEWDADYEEGLSVRARPGDNLANLIADYAPSLLVQIEDEIERQQAADAEDAREWLQQLRSY